MHLRVCIVAFLFCQPAPCFPACFIQFPFYLLGDPSSFACGANIHPVSSLVSYQLFSPCCLTHPEGTPQIKLHIYIDNINNISRPIWYKKCMRQYKCTGYTIYVCVPEDVSISKDLSWTSLRFMTGGAGSGPPPPPAWQQPKVVVHPWLKNTHHHSRAVPCSKNN